MAGLSARAERADGLTRLTDAELASELAAVERRLVFAEAAAAELRKRRWQHITDIAFEMGKRGIDPVGKAWSEVSQKKS